MAPRSSWFTRAAAAWVFAVGATALLGWILGREDLRSFFISPPVTVKTNTALGLMAGAAALWTLARRGPRRLLPRLLAVFLIALGAGTLSQHVAGWELGIDEALFREGAGSPLTASPNRMGPPAATSFLLLGIALLLIDARARAARTVGHGAATAVVAITMLSIIGYATDVSPMYGIARLTGISVMTALSLFVLAVGVLSARRDRGLAHLLSRRDESGTLARRLIVPSIVLPLLMALALTHGVRAGWFDDRFATAAMALAVMIGLTAIIWKTAADVSRALTERDAAEAESARREETTREVNERQREFLAVLSHELRNPLAPIRYALEMKEPWDGAAREVVHRQLGHLVRLVDDLLDVTRITTGRIVLRREPVSIEDVVRESVEAAQLDVERGGHRLDVSLPPEPVWIDADAHRLVQVITNLLNNAARYTPAGGRIQLAVAVEGDGVVVSVADSGIGLEQEDLSRVFEMFTRVGGPASSGLGIGLALVKTIVELHGGRVEAASEGPGRGAEFRVHLSRTSPPAAPLAVAAPADARPRTRTVVVADDNEDSADMMRSLLEIDGHRVHVAYDGPSAVERILAVGADAAVLDIGMPGLDGYEVARRVRAEGRRIYLIAVTGWGQEADRRRAHDAGFDLHLTKPADPDEIRRVLAAR